MISLQNNIALGLPHSVTTVPPSFSPSTNARWVNGLWFTSLACSLSAALVSMVVKQWLQWLQSTAQTASGTPQDRARLRQYRQVGLEAWHVPELINALPLLLHAALLLFFTGLVVLLWSLDLGITLATMFIVAAVYVFYCISTILPLFYPDCPYQTPVGLHLAQLLKLPQCILQPWSSSLFPSRAGHRLHISSKYDYAPSPSIDDVLDAKALCWLFGKSADDNVVSAALQALAGLPRDFTASQILRDANAAQLIEEGFMGCFQRDKAVVDIWQIIDLAAAELFIRAWMNVMRDTGAQWPLELVEPLWILRDTKPMSEATVIASCVVALSSYDSLTSQWELLSHLGKMASGEIKLAPSTQRWVIDSISECAVKWEMPKVVMEQRGIRAVPALLQFLHSAQDYSSSEVGHATALALGILTCESLSIKEFLAYHSEEKRKEDFSYITLRALAAVIEFPDKFAVSGGLLDILITDFACLASRFVAESERFPRHLRQLARNSLSRLFVAGKLSANTLSDPVLADVIQLLFPPRGLQETDQCQLVGRVIDVMHSSMHTGVFTWCVRLLEELFRDSSAISACSVFANADGINAVLRVCKIEDPEVHRLQVDSLRALCAFVQRCAVDYNAEKGAQTRELLDLIFESAFFDTLCQVVASRRWWLFEASAHWIPALLQLCRIRPHESVWKAVIEIFVEYAERNVREEGYLEAWNDLEEMRKLSDTSSA